MIKLKGKRNSLFTSITTPAHAKPSQARPFTNEEFLCKQEFLLNYHIIEQLHTHTTEFDLTTSVFSIAFFDDSLYYCLKCLIFQGDTNVFQKISCSLYCFRHKSSSIQGSHILTPT